MIMCGDVMLKMYQVSHQSWPTFWAEELATGSYLSNYNMIEVAAFFKAGWVTLTANFSSKGTSPTNIYWCHTTTVIILSCVIKLPAVCSFVSSQSTRVTDGQTDGQTDGRTDTQNCDPQYRACSCFARYKTFTFTSHAAGPSLQNPVIHVFGSNPNTIQTLQDIKDSYSDSAIICTIEI